MTASGLCSSVPWDFSSFHWEGDVQSASLSSINLLPFLPALSKSQDLESGKDARFWDSRDVEASSFSGFSLKKMQPVLSPVGLHGLDVMSDLSAHVSSGFQVADLLIKPGNSRAITPLGFATGFSLVTGVHMLSEEARAFKEAFSDRDLSSLFFAAVGTCRGALLTIGGAVFIPAQAMTVAALFTAAKALSAVADVLGKIGSGFFGVCTVLMVVNVAGKIHEMRRVNKGLDAIWNAPQISEEEKGQRALSYLQGLLGLSEEESEAIRFHAEIDPVHAKLPESERNLVIEKKLWTALAEKEAVLERLLGKECVKQIKAAAPEMAQELLGGVKKTIFEKRIVHAAALTLGVVGTIVSVAALIFSAPAALIAFAGVGLVTSLGWLVLDGFDLYKSFKAKEAGRFDYLLILVSAVVALVSISLVFALSGGIVPIVAGAVIGAVWLGVNLYSLYHLNQLKKKNVTDVSGD